ncbi:hypothetical protein CK203_087679 [Vitis vinifera]|uniref:Uncharacterized protein n=1 Tax=Vitis vinifera TaxID=29760 RepID=A0A438C7C9_VITVI|nr:hypothetical protein CK203_087679 [Vitis vinifera]
MPQAASTDPPTTPPVPQATPLLSQDFITIFGSDFHGMIQQHLGLAPPQTDIPGPSEPRAPTKETIPIEETITADVPPQAIHETAQSPHVHQRTPFLDHFFIFYLLSILVDIIYPGIGRIT